METYSNKDELEKGWRLACQTTVNNDHIQTLEHMPSPQFRIFLPDDFLFEDFQILTSGINKETNLNPAIKKIHLKVKKPSLNEPMADFERLISSSILFSFSVSEHVKSDGKDEPGHHI